MSDRPIPGTPPGRPQRCPYLVTCAPGRYAHCQCQKSAVYPFCDGSHRGSDVRPIKVVLETTRTIAWCACGGSRHPPYCDGSHADPPRG